MDNNSFIIRGGMVVCADQVLPDHDVIVVNGRIAAIEPTFDSSMSVQPDETVGLLPVIDARGAYVTPGMIDIHSDYVENVASPRPSVVMDLNTSLYKADRELVAHGITTIYHSLSVYGAKVFDHKPIRDFGNVSALIDRVADLRRTEERDHLIRHRLHMRIELDSVDLYDDIESYVRSGKVDLVSFMDHTPGQGQYSDLLLFGETLKGYRDLSDEEVREIIRQQQAADKMSYAQIAKLASIARERGISIASHDDDSTDKLAFMEGLEASISEFPISLDIAREARSRGMHTIAGAPNVMLGHSHSGNLSAREAVKAHAVDVLCSDYYPAALLDAVFALRDECGLSIDQAFSLVSINPAKATGIADELGSIAVGKRADILLVREIACGDGQTMPTVTRAFVGGHSVFRSHYPDQPLGYGRNADDAWAQAQLPANVGAGVGTGPTGAGLAAMAASTGPAGAGPRTTASDEATALHPMSPALAARVYRAACAMTTRPLQTKER